MAHGYVFVTKQVSVSAGTLVEMAIAFLGGRKMMIKIMEDDDEYIFCGPMRDPHVNDRLNNTTVDIKDVHDAVDQVLHFIKTFQGVRESGDVYFYGVNQNCECICRLSDSGFALSLHADMRKGTSKKIFLLEQYQGVFTEHTSSNFISRLPDLSIVLPQCIGTRVSEIMLLASLIGMEVLLNTRE